MKTMVAQTRDNFHEVILKQADELIENMRDVCPKDTGTLAASIRKKDISIITPGSMTVSVLVIAGGKTTTKRTLAGHTYDYAVATEFGTKKETPEPFFFNTARRYEQGSSEQYKETLEETIKENNEIRQIRADNENNQTSVNHRGAVVSSKIKNAKL
jgi:HK97 gp10 family phage protein